MYVSSSHVQAPPCFTHRITQAIQPFSWHQSVAFSTAVDFQKVEFKQKCWCSPAGGAPIPCWCKDCWFATRRQKEAAVQSGVLLEKSNPHLPSKEGGFCCNLQCNASASPSVLVYTPRRASLTHLPSEEGGFCYKASVCSTAVLCSSTSTSSTCATGASGRAASLALQKEPQSCVNQRKEQPFDSCLQ